MELIPVVDEKLTLKGFAERKWAEKQNLCHLTTLLIPISWESGLKKVHIQVRNEKKSFPSCRDVFGGHVMLDERFWPFLLGESLDLDEIVHNAAVREANEELRMTYLKNGETHPRILTQENVRRIGIIGEAKWDANGNVERSTMFIVPIPMNGLIHPMDDIEGVFLPVEEQKMEWKEVRQQFNANSQYAYKDREQAAKEGGYKNMSKWQFADGVARILRDDRLFELVEKAIEKLTKFDFEEA